MQMLKGGGNVGTLGVSVATPIAPKMYTQFCFSRRFVYLFPPLWGAKLSSTKNIYTECINECKSNIELNEKSHWP